MAAGPGNEIPALARDHSRLRASHADREQVIGTLKAAFVRGMLAKGELDARLGRAFTSRTYADLAALTADLPPGLADAGPPRRPARAQARPPMSTAAKAGICAAIAVAVPVVLSFATGTAIPLFLFTPFYLMALAVAVAEMVASWHDKRSRRGQLPQGPAPGAGGQASRRLPSTGPGRQLPSAGHGDRHAAEAVRSRRPRQRRACAETVCLPGRLVAGRDLASPEGASCP
jgi:Domain of unknown function (DUF1707)